MFLLKSNKLLDAIGLINDEAISDAKRGGTSAKTMWKKIAAVAACLSILLTSIGVAFVNHSGFFVGNETVKNGKYDNYSGPILPMTILNDIETIQAKRDIKFKISSDVSELGINCLISDNYSLMNKNDSEVSVDFAYPLVGNFQTIFLPNVKINEKEITYEILSGGYAGKFIGSDGNNNGSLNLKNNNSWIDYKKLLVDKNYIDSSLSYIPNLSQSVVVYKFTDIIVEDAKYSAATIRTTFNMDKTKSVVFTYGFEGSGVLENGDTYKDFFVPSKNDVFYNTPKYLIVFGEDISNYSLQGYQNSSCNPTDKLENANATVTRYETTMGKVMREIVQIYFEKNSKNIISPRINFEIFFEEVCRFFSSYSSLGESPKERYEDNRLDDIINEVPTHTRIMWITFNITIPAKTEVDIEIEYLKHGNYSFLNKTDNEILGYDIATTLGSNINFTQLTATIEMDDNIDIVRQNFGFNHENDNKICELNLNEEYYYLEVKSKK